MSEPTPQNPIAREAVAIAMGSLLRGAWVMDAIAATQVRL
jgi:hypothetical protein